ncbi:hypothetical protein M9Y10_034148 [Tritrichomonas musculus]|uniref:Ubiquitin-like domain-containing protein n=1 Tax=Tritrichomonas musculus TaxID=1915356 RepID=A0ABR2KE67_9EUKA
MINRQQSLPLNFVITIKLNHGQPKANSNSFLVPNDTPIPPTVVVKLSDPVSTIFDLIKSPNRQAKLIFNGQILCPTLTFAFYNIHNNDTIDIVTSPITASLSSADLTPNLPLKDQSSGHQVLVAAPRPIPISHRTRIESNSKNINKPRPTYNAYPHPYPGNRFPSQTPPPHLVLHQGFQKTQEVKQESNLIEKIEDQLPSAPIAESQD